MDLSRKILSDPVNEWVFSNSNKDIFLVGGYLRDLLRGHISKDRDFVLKGDIRQIGVDAAIRFRGTFIELKKDRTIRIALRNGDFIDFTTLYKDIREDLHQRDFTINAIAWSPKTGIIDPLKGETDLKKKAVKAINPDNLVADPLRILRAYRMAAQLGFNIDESTSYLLRKYAMLTTNVSSERITDELLKILNNDQAARVLSLCLDHNVLIEVLGCNKMKLQNNIDLIMKFDHLIKILKTRKKRKILQLLDQNISQGLKRKGLIRLALLLMNTENSAKRGHLRLSRKNRKKINRIHESSNILNSRLTRKNLYFIFMEAGDSVYEAAFILSTIKGKKVDFMLEKADDFVRIRGNPPLSGKEIQQILRIKPGKVVGEIKNRIEQRMFLGYIRNKAEARQWIVSNFT